MKSASSFHRDTDDWDLISARYLGFYLFYYNYYGIKLLLEYNNGFKQQRWLTLIERAWTIFDFRSGNFLLLL
jgi:hypothetical protein